MPTNILELGCHIIDCSHLGTHITKVSHGNKNSQMSVAEKLS